jgi:hypothetical protein
MRLQKKVIQPLSGKQFVDSHLFRARWQRQLAATLTSVERRLVSGTSAADAKEVRCVIDPTLTVSRRSLVILIQRGARAARWCEVPS